MKELSIGLPSLELSGCNAKLGANQLLRLIDSSAPNNVSLLAPDCGETGIASGTYATIDTIFPITRSARSYGCIALLHALNDLYARGVSPTDICISLALTESSLKEFASDITNELTHAVISKGLRISKRHTYLAREISLTISAIGLRKTSTPFVEKEANYKLILTKPLGASIAYHLGILINDENLALRGEQSMLMDHGAIVHKLLGCCNGTTDVSGFGLLGHLVCSAIHQKLAITVFVDQIPIIDGLLEISQLESLANCSSKRNESDFNLYCDWQSNPSVRLRRLLFAGETAGPIVSIVNSAECETFLSALNNLGFTSSAIIGNVALNNNATVKIT